MSRSPTWTSHGMGIRYTAANTRTGSLTFDSAGNLVEWDFGTACIPNGGGCLVRLPPPGIFPPGECCRDWVVIQDHSHNHILFFEYGRPDNSFRFGTATVTRLGRVTPALVPTLSDAGQIILALLLLMSAVW